MNTPRNLWFFLLVTAILVMGLIGSMFFPPFMVWSGLAALMVGAILLGNPRGFLYTYLSVMAVYPLIKSLVSSGPVQYLNEVMGAVLYAMFFGHLVFRRLHLDGVGKLFRRCAVFFVYCLLVGVGNRAGIKGMLQFFFMYGAFVPLFFLVREYFKARDFVILLKWSVLFFSVNFALNMGWWFRVNPLPNYHVVIGNMYDHALGTFDGCNYVAYFCVMLIFLLVALLLTPELLSRRMRQVCFIILALVFVQLYLTFTNHAYFFAAVATIPFMVMTRLWKKWYMFAGVALMIGVFVFAISRDEMTSDFLTKENITYRYNALAESPKIQLYQRLLVKNLEENPVEWIFGVGPGNGMGHIGMVNGTPFAYRMLLEYYQMFSQLQESTANMSSVTGHTYSVVFSIWGDLGVIGFILYCSIYFLLAKKTYQKLRTGDKRDVAVFHFLMASLLFWMIVSLVVDAMNTVIPLWLWVWAGWLLSRERGDSPEQAGCQ